jgi:hypothetical protein
MSVAAAAKRLGQRADSVRPRNYEAQTDEEAAAEHDAAHRSREHTLMEVPIDLVPVVRELIAQRRAG